jgi:hypothetical protein
MPTKAGPLAVGSDTLAYCTSCKMDLNSVIVAMKGDRVAKVQCLTCKKEHVFKAPKGIDTPAAATAKAKRASKKKEAAEEEAAHSIEVEWEKLMSTHKDAPIKPYTTKGHFVLGDKIHHTTFGDGIVGKLIYPNKVEVIFRTDLKILIYAGVLQTFAS